MGTPKKDRPIEVGGGKTLDGLSLVDSRLLVCANSGGGKSYALRGIAEQIGASIPTIILDPEGEFSTLREKLDMVLVGPGGEVATDPRGAKLLARKLVELHLSAVVDLSELSLAERRRFVRIFLEALLQLPRKLWHPTLIVLDEAHKFCPERGSGQAESTDAVISLMAQGRKRGFGGCLATQRLSKLHKDAVGECNNVMIGRCVQDVDLKRAGDVLGLKGNRDKLRSMKPGEFYGYGPAFGHDGIERWRSRKVETTHPDSRTRSKLKPTAPSAKIRKVLGELEDLPAQAEAELQTLKAAQDRARELEREVAKLKRGQPKPEIDHDAMAREVTKAVNKAVADRDKEWQEKWRAAAARVHLKHREIRDEMQRIPQLPPPTIHTKLPPRPRQTAKPPPTVTGGTAAEELGISDSDMPTAVAKTLTVLAEYPDGLEVKRLGFLAGVSITGGSWGRAGKYMRERGYIERDGTKKLKITPAGLAVVPPVPPRPTGPELLDYWRGKLENSGAVAIWDCLVQWHPERPTAGDIGAYTGLSTTGGSWGRSMKELRQRGMMSSDGSPRRYGLDPDMASAAGC